MSKLSSTTVIDSAVVVFWIIDDHWYDDHSTSSIHSMNVAWDAKTIGTLKSMPSFNQTRLATFILNPDNANYTVNKDKGIGQFQRLNVTSAVKTHLSTPTVNYGFMLTNWADHGHDGFTFSSSEADDINHRPALIVYSKSSTGVKKSTIRSSVKSHLYEKSSYLGLNGRRLTSKTISTNGGISVVRDMNTGYARVLVKDGR